MLIVNFEHISLIALVFSLMNKQMLTGSKSKKVYSDDFTLNYEQVSQPVLVSLSSTLNMTYFPTGLILWEFTF